jgi:non-homologous end joining protein Ku
MPWGEILLVVIGILIALQINNWNDHRKNEDFERSILELIDQNLAADKEILKEEISKTTQAIELTDLLLEHVAQNILVTA